MTMPTTTEPPSTSGAPPPLHVAIERNLIACCQYCLASSEGTNVRDTEEAFWFSSGVPFPLYNGIYRPKFEGDAATRMAALLAPFQATKTPLVTCLGPLNQDPELADVLKKQGMIKVATLPGMSLALSELSADWVERSQLEIKEVLNETDLWAWIEVQTISFELPPWLKQTTFNMTHKTVEQNAQGPKGPVRLYLGRAGGLPVATAMTVRSDGVVGIYNVGCLPEARRMGFGAAITAGPLLKARAEGETTAILHASPAGEPLYKAMGFVPQCTLDHYLYARWYQLLGLLLDGLYRKLQGQFRRWTHRKQLRRARS